MKQGDKVRLKYSFDIDDYSLEYASLKISIRINEDTKENWEIPLSIGALGIYPKGNRFAIPGDYLPKDHPQYYKMVDNNKYIVELNHSAYRIILEESFYLDGRYRLVPLDRELVTLHRVAVQHTEEWLRGILEDIKGSTIDGDVLNGIVVRMYEMRNGGIKYYKHLHEKWVKSTNPKYVVIHDEDTNIEYPLPFDCLAIK